MYHIKNKSSDNQIDIYNVSDRFERRLNLLSSISYLYELRLLFLNALFVWCTQDMLAVGCQCEACKTEILYIPL